jgi:hypothetical protein
MKLWKRLSRGRLVREVHHTPDWAVRRLAIHGGLNCFDEPNYTVTWGWNLLTWVGGLWEDRDNEGNLIREVLAMRKEPKYPMQKNRWIVQRWLPPEKFGSPDTWNRNTKEWGEEGNVPQLGPYPSRGRYQLLCIVNTPAGGFLQLTETILDDVIYAFVTRTKNRQTLQALKDIELKKKQAIEEYDREFIREGVPAFGYNDHVGVL